MTYRQDEAKYQRWQNYKPFIVENSIFGFSNSLPSGFIKLTANTGLKIKATINDAANVRIRIVGR